MSLSRLTPRGGRNAYTAAWLGWLAAFFVIELPPIWHHHPQDTLSDHVWLWFGVPQHPTPPEALRARRIALLGFLAWLMAHFLSGDEV